MTTPNYAVIFSAQLVGSTTVTKGQVLIPSASDPSVYVVATTANRGTRRSEGIATTSFSGIRNGSVQLQQAGTIDATLSGLAAGSQTWVRCSATGTIERIVGSPGVGDDIIGLAEADGRVHLFFGTLTPTIVNGGGGTPGGSDTQLQYNNAGSFGGTANLAYVAGKLQTSANIQWKNGLVTGDLAWTPTGTSKTITLPDATGTVVLNDNTATLVAKTISGASNTITNVSLTTGVTGTLPIGNGGTGLTAVPGSNGQFIVNAGGTAFGAGGSNWTLGGTGNQGLIGAAGAFVSFGTSPATIGSVRLMTTGTDDLVSMAYTGINVSLIRTDALILKFSDVNFQTEYSGYQVVVKSYTAPLYLHGEGILGVTLTSTDVKMANQVTGDQSSSVPFRLKKLAIAQNSTSTLTLSAAQYENPYLEATGAAGGAFIWQAPASTGAFFVVKNSNSSSMTFRSGVSGGVTIAAGKSACVIHNGSNYELAAAAVP